MTAAIEELLSLPARVEALERAVGGSCRPRLRVARLPDHERDMLPFLAAGWTNKEIARELLISEKTVRGRVSHMLRSLNLANRTALALYALATGQASLCESINLMVRLHGHLVVGVHE